MLVPWRGRRDPRFLRSVCYTVGEIVALALLLCSSAAGGDWPQILGPRRNGIAEKESIGVAWPAAGPPVVWQRPVGRGYSGVAVADGKLVLFHRLDDRAVVEALDARSGKTLWKQSFPTRYASGIAPDDGPRCVPLIYQDAVYVLGAEGDLHALSLADGKTRWSRDLNQDFKVPDSYFGVGATPIIASDRLLVNVGGKGAGLVAFALKDGATLWKATDEAASYASPVAATAQGLRHVVFLTRMNVVSVDPENGRERFRFPFGQRGPTVNAANPLVIGDSVFVTASYGVGAQLATIRPEGVKTVWENDQSLSSQYATPMHNSGVLYGLHGRQDGPPPELRAVELATGKVLWSETNFGAGNLIMVGNRLLISKTDGELVLAQVSATSYRKLASSKVFDTTVQALPALADGRLYLRDTKSLACFDLRAPRISPGS